MNKFLKKHKYRLAAISLFYVFFVRKAKDLLVRILIKRYNNILLKV